MKVLDVRCTYSEWIAKVQQQDGEIAFYAVADGINKASFSGDTITPVKGNYIGKFEGFKANKVVDFAVGKDSAFFIIGGEKPIVQSIIPEKPEATGLIHFYKKQGVEDWSFMTEEEYKTKKDELPPLSFATRHPIADFKDKDFPDLEALTEQVAFKEGLEDYPG
jgi:hypothetical protein